MSTEKHDELIKRFSLSYPNVIDGQPKNLWNFYRYGLSNRVYVRGLDIPELSLRAQKLNKLPDGTAIIIYFISVVNNKYKDRITRTITLTRSDTGTYESLADLAEARRDIIELTRPYLNNPIEESDFSAVTSRFSGGLSSVFSGGQSWKTDESKTRRSSFRSVVLRACRGNFKPGRVLFEQFLKEKMSVWNPKTYPVVWHLTSVVQFDSITRERVIGKVGPVTKIEVKIQDFDSKFVGTYGIVPYHQWAKTFVYSPGHNRFVNLEKEEKKALNKAFQQMIGQPLILKINVPNLEKLYPYIFEENGLEYDGNVPKTSLAEKYVYLRSFNSWIFNEKEITDTTSDYRITKISFT